MTDVVCHGVKVKSAYKYKYRGPFMEMFGIGSRRVSPIIFVVVDEVAAVAASDFSVQSCLLVKRLDAFVDTEFSDYGYRCIYARAIAFRPLRAFCSRELNNVRGKAAVTDICISAPVDFPSCR